MSKSPLDVKWYRNGELLNKETFGHRFRENKKHMTLDIKAVEVSDQHGVNSAIFEYAAGPEYHREAKNPKSEGLLRKIARDVGVSLILEHRIDRKNRGLKPYKFHKVHHLTDKNEHERSGRESDVDNNRLRQLLESDPRRATRELAQDLGVHYASIARHLHQLGEVRKLAQWVPHNLTERDRQPHDEVATIPWIRSKIFG
ncbi:unnamed protein product [Heligmosomoides polygyrus]|uniref:Winged helix-turn-helix domain-containing protein n=1 Tax=Heligmosomoides polygyrus TaxID=6339 RepID=A0A183G5V2_HELPZ|nr:unnamed protein product [Heligmosomoides polygyrus]